MKHEHLTVLYTGSKMYF